MFSEFRGLVRWNLPLYGVMYPTEFITVARLANRGSNSCCGYCDAGMSSSSVHFTPCCAGKNPVIRVARLGEHMHALQYARSKLSPFFLSRVIPGRLASAHPGGKC